MLDHAAFQHAFGALLADEGDTPVDPALARAVAIHRNTSLRAAEAALADNYPVARQLLGGEAFEAAALAFAEAHPPADPRLCVYGETFPSFLRAWPPFAEVTWVANVAKLERAMVEALFARDAPASDALTFGGNLDLTAPLVVHPAARIVEAATPIVDLWKAHQNIDAPDLDGLAWEGQSALVTRPSGIVNCVTVAAEAGAFLAACRAGQTLGQAAADAGAALPLFFGTLVIAGAFTSNVGNAS